jgi:hypothetical protein
MNSCLKVFGLVTGEQKIAVWLSSLPYVTASVQLLKQLATQQINWPMDQCRITRENFSYKVAL